MNPKTNTKLEIPKQYAGFMETPVPAHEESLNTMEGRRPLAALTAGELITKDMGLKPELSAKPAAPAITGAEIQGFIPAETTQDNSSEGLAKYVSDSRLATFTAEHGDETLTERSDSFLGRAKANIDKVLEALPDGQTVLQTVNAYAHKVASNSAGLFAPFRNPQMYRLPYATARSPIFEDPFEHRSDDYPSRKPGQF